MPCFDHVNRTGSINSTIQEQPNTLRFTGRLWETFRSILSGALNDLRKRLGCSKETIMETMDKYVNAFFVHSLQLDVLILSLEYG